jgi:ethanolamine utilization protein EutN
MRIGRVSGTVVSTISHPFYSGRRLLICDLVTPDGREEGGYLIAVDTVEAGPGDTVLILDEGNSSRQIFGVDTGPIRTTIVGIVDHVEER